MDSDAFPDIEQDNNPSFYNTSANAAHGSEPQPDTVAEYIPVSPSKNGHKDTLQESYVDFGSKSLMQDSLGLSQKIKKMLNSPRLAVDVISSERLGTSAVVVYLIELRVGAEREAPVDRYLDVNRRESANPSGNANANASESESASANPGGNANLAGRNRTADSVIVKRRYSEFKSLRDNLVKLFPTQIIPPIPEKHTLLTYLINALDTTKELSVIDVRKRYFCKFLRDVVFDSPSQVRNCPLVLKFFDPNYELAWENAVSEPPVSLLPQNLLLANPNNPTDQNGLYLLLPAVAGFDVSTPDNLASLAKINGDLHKLHNDVKVFSLKETHSSELPENHAFSFFRDIPPELISFERNLHQNIRILADLHKLNGRNIRNLKQMVDVLIELGGNLNNFSLQVHEMVTTSDGDNNQLSRVVERFGSTMDSGFLTLEHFLHDHVVPAWDEPVNQFAQYYMSALQLVKFYKYKLLQYKLLHKLKFAKIQELSNSSHNQESLRRLKELNIDSPAIAAAIRRIESKQKSRKSLGGKKSWYGLFGGNKPTFSLPEEHYGHGQGQGQGSGSGSGQGYMQERIHAQTEGNVPAEALPVSSEAAAFPPAHISTNFQHRVQHIEKELDKLDQLIGLFNDDMEKLTENLSINFHEFTVKMEKKWLRLMIDLVRAGKQLCEENLATWTDLKTYVGESSADGVDADRVAEALAV